MKLPSRLFLAGALASSLLSVSAQTMKPGLWEVSTKMGSGSGEMAQAMAQAQKQLGNLPAAQRKQLEEMMAQRGVAMGDAAGAVSVKVCLTQEMIDRNETSAHEGDCKQSSSARSGNSMKFTVVCSKPPSAGEGQITVLSPTAYSSKMNISTVRNGKPETMTLDSSGKFLSGDCGTIKPITAAKKN